MAAVGRSFLPNNANRVRRVLLVSGRAKVRQWWKSYTVDPRKLYSSQTSILDLRVGRLDLYTLRGEVSVYRNFFFFFTTRPIDVTGQGRCCKNIFLPTGREARPVEIIFLLLYFNYDKRVIESVYSSARKVIQKLKLPKSFQRLLLCHLIRRIVRNGSIQGERGRGGDERRGGGWFN